VTIGITHLLVVSAALFCIGVFGLLSRRNAIALLMSVELMFNGVNVALVGFARFGYSTLRPLSGMAFALFVITIAAAEVAVAVALLLVAYRRHQTVQADELDELHG
jgi:NADH:ubiquinone oxidoreductase subunit K